MRMDSKIGIVTAAASGMGRAGALRFAREGARVAVVDVDAPGVRRVVDEITGAGGAAHGIVADLTNDDDSRRVVWDTVSRFKGLGEMPARYLKATTMDPGQRTLLRVTLPAKADPAAIEAPADELARTQALVETLMGRRAELRFEYIQKNARFARDLDV